MTKQIEIIASDLMIARQKILAAKKHMPTYMTALPPVHSLVGVIDSVMESLIDLAETVQSLKRGKGSE